MPGFGKSFELKRAYDTLGCCHIVIYAVELIRSAVLIFLDKAPASAADRLKGFEGHGELAWSEPTSVDVRICMCLENQFARRIEFPCDEEFLFSWLNCDCCLIF